MTGHPPRNPNEQPNANPTTTTNNRLDSDTDGSVADSSSLDATTLVTLLTCLADHLLTVDRRVQLQRIVLQPKWLIRGQNSDLFKKGWQCRLELEKARDQAN